ncbi:MAG: M28 family metallopeptidase [Planctomycetota bacterium]|jgi:Zn-dependent M28 family amino/carboxypeptidase
MSLAHLGILAIASAPCLLLGGCGGYEGPVEGARAFEKVEKLVSFGPRPAGSSALRSTAAYIESEIKSLGLPVNVQDFEDPEQAPGIQFRNVWTEIPGKDPTAGPIILIGAHYDTKLASGHSDPAHNFPFVGAIDGGGASGVLLELARVLRKRPNPVANIWLVWFDGEESIDWDWNEDRSLFGSRHFVKTMSADKIRFPSNLGKRMRAMILMDLIGDRRIKLDRDGNSNKKLQDLFLEAAAKIGAEHKMYRFKSAFSDDHIPFRDAGVRVIDLIDFHYRTPSSRSPDEPSDIARYEAWWHTAEDTLDKISPDSLEFVGDLVWTAIPMIEKDL